MRKPLIYALVVCQLLPAGGCTRRFFRGATDKEVEHIIAAKDKYPEWAVEQFHVYPDPQARFADWTNPDRPPMPPDDPATHDQSPNPQRPGKQGVQYIEGTGYLDLLGSFDAENRAEQQIKQAEQRARGEQPSDTYGVEGFGVDPYGASDLPTPLRTRERPFRIKLEQAVALGQINSREYQTRRENLYLTALPVTLERFAFAAQPFAFGQAIREHTGSQTTDGLGERWRLNGDTGFSKLFSTGALLLTRFANRTAINMTGVDQGTVSVSQIDLDIVQPLLRGGGRAVTLEPLTQAERDLLYGIRDYYRFRQEFFVSVAAGDPIGSGTIGTLGAFATFTPLPGAGDVRPVAFGPGIGGRLNPLLNAFTTPQGYLVTVLQQARLTNEYKNVRSLESYLDRFEVYREGGIVTQVQVGQIEQNLLDSRNNVLTLEADLRVFLDQFKLQLGVPPIIPIELDDAVLEPLYQQARKYELNSAAYNQLADTVAKYGNADEVKLLRDRLEKQLTTAPFVSGLPFQKTVLERWQPWRKLARKDDIIDRLREARKKRRPLLDRQAELAGKGQDLPDAEQQQLDDLNFEIDLGEFELALRTYEEQPWLKVVNPQIKAAQQARMFDDAIGTFLGLLEVPFRQRQIQLKQSWPDLPDMCVDGQDLLRVDYDQAEALVARTALTNRVDLMNARAQLVDSWRKIAVTANALLGVFNVQYHMDSSTPLGEAMPLAFSGSRSRHQLILSGELPLVRLPERNDYRIALIAYQRQRRNLMAAEDAVVFSVRAQLNQLRALRDRYERVQQRAVELAYQQVDQALQAFSQPQQPTGPGREAGAVGAPESGGVRGGDPAALTQQLLNAQNSLLRAQNNLYAIWIEYQRRRMSLFRDLNLMPLDQRGVWNDGIATCIGPEEQPGTEPELPAPRVLPPIEE